MVANDARGEQRATLRRAVLSCPLCGDELACFADSPGHYNARHATPEERDAGHLRVPFRLLFELAMPDGTLRQIDSGTEDPEELALLKTLDGAELARAIGATVGAPAP